MSEDKNIEQLIARGRKICHDLNQPLTVIMARSELLKLNLSADDPNVRSVEQIHIQADKMSGLVEDMRALFKEYQDESE